MRRKARLGTHPDDIMHMTRTADRLFGDNCRWSVPGAGDTAVEGLISACVLVAPQTFDVFLRKRRSHIKTRY